MQITMTIPKPLAFLRYWKWLALALVALAPALLGPAAPVAALGNSITSPDTAGDVGQSTSLALDSYGNPVVTYGLLFGGPLTSTLKILRCGDPNCTTVTAVGGLDHQFPNGGNSLVLDSGDNPVVSYFHTDSGHLRAIHCTEPYCIGIDATPHQADSGCLCGSDSSITLDSLSRPVISYGALDLWVTHCGTADCSSGNTTMSVLGSTVEQTSIALDGAGRPIVSFHNISSGALGLLHCGSTDCSFANSIVSPDAGNVGQFSSLKLDGSGNPVVSYYDYGNGNLKLMRCNDGNCAGGDESIVTIDALGDVGKSTSLELDGLGHPVISYYDATNGDLKLVRCGDANCFTYLKVFVDQGGDVGQFTSLELDGSGNPVISYYDATNQDLKIAHCIDSQCLGDKAPTVLNLRNIGLYALPKSCFDVGAGGVTFFTVCDNDFAGAPASNGHCAGDGVCNDEDPTPGSVQVTMTPGDYSITESTIAPEHTDDGTSQVCDISGCSLTFVNAPRTRPWFPWDLVGVSGPSGPLDGKVTVGDIIAVIQHYNQTKPLPTETPTPSPTPTPCIFC